MNKEKIRGFIKTKIGACVLTGLITFVVTGVLFNEEAQLQELSSKVEKSIVELEKKDTEIKDLSDKVASAKPYFDMKAEEQAQLAEKVRKEEEDRVTREAADKEAKNKAELEAKSVTLENGNFVSGTDFEPGVYDIIAISGGGNVVSSNMFDGGINAIMGDDNKIAEMNGLGMGDMYKKEYKNIKLPNSVTLSLDGVGVKLVPKN